MSSFPYEPPRSDLESISAIAPTLTESELRLLIDLTVNGSGSVRMLAARTGLASSSVTLALRSLERRKLIDVRRGEKGQTSIVFATVPRVSLLRENLRL